MGEAEVTALLSYLATERNVAASTQNQALSAILFLYKRVLGVDLPWLDDVTRARRPQRLPFVIGRDDVKQVLDAMHGTNQLVARLLYGTGMRVLEGLRLRIGDLDFGYQQVRICSGKGERARVTILPESLALALRAQLERARALHARDLKAGFGAVHLPHALLRKYRHAAHE